MSATACARARSSCALPTTCSPRKSHRSAPIVEQAQASLENAAAAYRRAQSLSGSGALSQSDLDKLRSEELAARARVEVAQGRAARLPSCACDYTRVTAPDDGVISARNVDVGQIAQVGGEMLRLVAQGSRRMARRNSRIAHARDQGRSDREADDGRRRAARRQGAHGRADRREHDARRARLRRHPVRQRARPGMFARGEIVLEHSAAQMAAARRAS